MRHTAPVGFEIKPVTLVQKGFSYQTFRLSGWLNGRRVRKQFKSYEEAAGEKLRLEVQRANASNPTVRTVFTRLTEDQVAEAEACIRRLGGKSLTEAVDWFLANYKPPLAEMALETARDSFIADRTPHVSRVALRDYKRTLRDFIAMYPKHSVHAFTTTDCDAFLKARKIGPKRFNNLRGDLNAFFNFCVSPARKWAAENPVEAIPKFKIARGLPEIISPEKAAQVMAFVEAYDGGKRRGLSPGCLAPYFALCLFAGIRPSVRDGEIRKLGDSPDCAKLVDVVKGIIRITPEISKTFDLRWIRIQPNLAAWLTRYPLDKFPIVVRNLQDMVTFVRRKFDLADDVLRHTMISAHVAKFRSLGEAALEAGNSEAMIRKHYLNMLTTQEAEAFWTIRPKL